MALIEYIGKKASRADTVAGTKVVWNGPGDVQEVPDLAVFKLLKHPDVWALVASKPQTPKQAEAPVVEESPTAEAKPQTDDTGNVPGVEDAPKAEHIMRTDSGKPLVLDTLDLATLRELAKEQGIKVGNSGAERIRERLAEAFPMVG